jgi:hypothetical protein
MRDVVLQCVVLCFLAVAAHGSQPEILWNARFPNNSGSVVWDAVEVVSGGYIAVGEVSSGVHGEEAFNVCGIDGTGAIMWENTALNFGCASGYSIQQAGSGFVICGVCSDSRGRNGLVTKTDAAGNILWSLDTGYENEDVLFGICVDEEGNSVSVGYSLNTETSDNDILAVCVSDSGYVVWKKRYVAPGYQSAYSVIPSSDNSGGFFITGSDAGDVFLMKIDSQGNWLWKTNHFLDGNQIARSLTESSEGGFIVAGSTVGNNGYPDALLVFFDDDGKVASDHVWGTDGPDNAYSIQEVPPAGFVVLLNSNTGTGEGYRPYLVRFDPWLTAIWSVKISDTDAFCYSFVQNSSGGFLVSGKTATGNGGNEYSSCAVLLSPEDLLNWEEDSLPVMEENTQ